MKTIAVSIFALYFLCGCLLLPQGDFEAMKDLPAMYAHCKAAEDKDMTPFDFVTDHLLNIDGMFDQHDNGDEQKPHKPIEYHLNQNIAQLENKLFRLELKNIFPLSNSVQLSTYQPAYHSNSLNNEIFRPPIAV